MNRYDLLNYMAIKFFVRDILDNFETWDNAKIINPSRFNKYEYTPIYVTKIHNIDTNIIEITFDNKYYYKNDLIAIQEYSNRIFLEKPINDAVYRAHIIYPILHSKTFKLPAKTRYISNYAPDLWDQLMEYYKNYINKSYRDKAIFLKDIKASLDE